jgi:drug/metabolite transporter (DMT)-like permease
LFAKYRGTLLVIASAAGFGTLAIFIKYAYAAGANTTTILAFRFLLAAIVFWGFIKARGLKIDIGKDMILRVCALGGIGYGTMSSLFAGSVKELPASLAAMLLYTYPAQVSMISFLLGDEAFTWRKGAALGICFAGLSLVLDTSFAQVNLLGLAFALLAAFVYSIYIVMGNRLLRQVDSLVTTTLVCSSAAAVFFMYGIITGDLMFRLPLEGWFAISGMAVFGTVIAIISFFAGMSSVGAANASIISTVEPVVTVILSALLLGESTSGFQTVGGGFILAGVLILQLPGQRSQQVGG